MKLGIHAQNVLFTFKSALVPCKSIKVWNLLSDLSLSTPPLVIFLFFPFPPFPPEISLEDEEEDSSVTVVVVSVVTVSSPPFFLVTVFLTLRVLVAPAAASVPAEDMVSVVAVGAFYSFRIYLSPFSVFPCPPLGLLLRLVFSLRAEVTLIELNLTALLRFSLNVLCVRYL